MTNPLALLLTLLGARCANWALVGGYRGVEGEMRTKSLNNIEILNLEDETDFEIESSWSQQNVSSALEDLDGGTINMVNMFDFIDEHQDNPKFSSPHGINIFDRPLICGGADTNYKITNECRWMVSYFGKNICWYF